MCVCVCVQINDLNAGVQTLKHSYGSIIKSLVHMHNRRMKKKKAEAKPSSNGKDGKEEPKEAQPITLMTTLSEISKQQARQMEMENSCLSQVDKYDVERFINPVTREDTFKALFAECAQLSDQTVTLRTKFFDAKANFLPDEYRRHPALHLTRKRFNHYRLWCKKLATVVDDLCRNYNDDLLNMFRLDA